MGQLVVGLDLAAEEVAKGGGQQRRPGRRRCAQQSGQVRVVFGEGVGDPGHGPPRLLDQPLRVGVAPEAGRLPGDLRRRSALHGQQARLAEALEFVQAIAAEIGGRAVEGDGVAVEEDLHLLADALVVAGGEEDLDAVEQGVAGQGDAEGLPGPVVGVLQGFRQRLAVVAEALLDGPDDLHGVVGEVADHLPQSEADQLRDDRHGALPPGRRSGNHTECIPRTAGMQASDRCQAAVRRLGERNRHRLRWQFPLVSRRATSAGRVP